MIRFATWDWAEDMPWVVGGQAMRDIVAQLPAGITLAEAYPDEFPPFVPAPVEVAPLPVPPVVVTQPVVTPSARLASTPALSVDTSSSSRGPAPVLVPPARTSSRSPAALSPAQTPSPAVLPASSRSPSTGSGAGPAPPSTPGSAPSPSVPLPPTGGSRSVRSRRAAPAAPAVPTPSAAPDAAKSARVSFFCSSPFPFGLTLFPSASVAGSKRRSAASSRVPLVPALCVLGPARSASL